MRAGGSRDRPSWPTEDSRPNRGNLRECSLGSARKGSSLKTGRLEAFSDGVIAIIITIMVLELKAPGKGESIWPMLYLFPSYVLSFIYVGIYWNNHHHLMHATQRVSGAVLWANLHLLFWMSLVPFVTNWTSKTAFDSISVAAYGFVLLMSAASWTLLNFSIRRLHGNQSLLSQALAQDSKERLSILLYVVGIGTAFWLPYLACALYAVVAAIWLVPDQRMERAYLAESGENATSQPADEVGPVDGRVPQTAPDGEG